MPKSRAILDSSPVAFASPRRPLKRSASTASLPTPPRTHHKRTHSRGSASAEGTDGDSDSGDEHRLGSDDGVVLLGNKKRRTSLQVKEQTIGEEEEENEFWVGSAKDKSGIRNRTGITTRSPSPSPSISPSPLLLRTLPQAPVSPPPSRRQTTVHVGRPVTPKPSSSTVDDSSGPVRDSPNNPFLADSPISLDGEPRTPSPPADFVEKPTITYVFRGMKAEFANPLYQLSPSTRARAALPIEHPDYSPTGACPPRLLFPALHRAKHPRTPSPRRGRRRRSPDDEDLVPPKRLTFQKELELLQKTGSGVDVGELGGIGIHEEKDDPIRLAMGPVRR